MISPVHLTVLLISYVAVYWLLFNSHLFVD